MKTVYALMMLVAGAGLARADVPPPDDYVEGCTVEKQQVAGLECQSCSAWHGERDACEKTLGAQGMRHMCKSWGASSWSEVWCKGEATVTPAPADAAGSDPGASSEPKKGGCAGGGVSVLALLGLALMRRDAR